MDISLILEDNGRVVTLTPVGQKLAREGIVTCNEWMQRNLALLKNVANSELCITICGEPGTNKQDYAEFVHRHSTRAAGPYVRFDCAATRESQYESRLFGTIEGRHIRHGLLEAGGGGTVLLDGISDIPEAFYEKLERVLDSGAVVRRGSREKTTVNIRLVATCGEDMMSLIARKPRIGRLLQRLSAVRVDVLPLRQRREDIALLTLHYLEEANSRYGVRKRMGSALFREIVAHDWPGNERELRSFMEQLVLVYAGDVLDDPEMLRSTERLAASVQSTWKRAELEDDEDRSLKEQVREYELMLIRQSISKYGSLRKAAAALKVDASVLSRKLSARKE